MTTILGPIINLLQTILDGLHGLGLAWGWAIVGLTVVVRVLLVPLAVRQQRSTQQMQALQPQLKKLQARYKDDREALQRETMALYQKAKVNPLASCLPLLVQMPVFLALFYTIRGTEALNAAPFLWLPALGNPDPTHLLLVIYVATQLISTQLSLTPETASSQRWMMRLLPLVMALFLIKFPAGLFVYWVTSNVWTIFQQLVLRRWLPPGKAVLVDDDAAPAKAAVAAGAGGDGRAAGGRRKQQDGRPARQAKPHAGQKKQAGAGAKAGAKSGGKASARPGATSKKPAQRRKPKPQPRPKPSAS